MISQSLDDLALLALHDSRGELLAVQVRVKRLLDSSLEVKTEADARAYFREVQSLSNTTDIVEFDLYHSWQKILNSEPQHIGETVAETIQPKGNAA